MQLISHQSVQIHEVLRRAIENNQRTESHNYTGGSEGSRFETDFS